MLGNLQEKRKSYDHNRNEVVDSRLKIFKLFITIFNYFICLNILPLTVLPEALCAKIVDRIVAVVNDDIISLSELNQGIKPYLDKIKGLNYSSEKKREMFFKVRENFLDQLINKKHKTEVFL